MGSSSDRTARALTLVTLGAVLVAGLGTTACGDAGQQQDLDDQRRAAVAAARELQRAFASRDLEALCAGMTATAKRQAGLMAHGSPGACEQDLRRAFGIVRPNGGWASARGGKATATVDGDRATVTFAGGGRRPLDVALALHADRWRLDSFFGTPPKVAEAYVAGARRASVPARGGAVEAGDGAGSPCFELIEDDFPKIVGTCGFVAKTERIAVDVSTVFGDFEFGDCTLSYRVQTGPDGATWTNGVLFHSPVNNGCADVRPCETADNEDLPWKGRIRSIGDGVLVHRMNVCLDTCVGFYTGTLALRLRPIGGRWRAEAVDAGVGASGFLLDGRLATAPADLDLRAAR